MTFSRSQRRRRLASLFAGIFVFAILIAKGIELVTTRQMSAKEAVDWTQTNAIADLKKVGVNL